MISFLSLEGPDRVSSWPESLSFGCPVMYEAQSCPDIRTTSCQDANVVRGGRTTRGDYKIRYKGRDYVSCVYVYSGSTRVYILFVCYIPPARLNDLLEIDNFTKGWPVLRSKRGEGGITSQ